MRGAPKFDMTGERHGRLVVMEYAGSPRSRWLCLCDCGEKREAERVARLLIARNVVQIAQKRAA